MNRYSTYGPRDFALDQFFQKWLTAPDDDTIRYWNAFISENPDKVSEITEAIQLVRDANLSADHEANTYFLETWKQIDSQTRKAGQDKRRKVANYSLLVAAFAGLAILVVYLLVPGNDYLEYNTAFGEVRKVELADGSVVTLNANSRIRIDAGFNQEDERNVFLEGEAFFNVAKSETKTFTVATSREVGVRVLGTQFNVNTRNDHVHVYLQSGKVNLYSAANSIVLSPGQSGELDRASSTVVISSTPETVQQERIAWRDGLYIMNDKQVSEIFSDIRDNFGFDVIASVPEIAARRITAKIPAGDLDLLLQVLAETLDVQIERKNKQVIVTPK